MALAALGVAIVGRQPAVLWLLWALVLLVNGGPLLISRREVLVDAEGVHLPIRVLAWSQVEAVRPNHVDDCVVLVLKGGKERRLGLPSAMSEQVAAIGSKPLRRKI